VGRGTWGLGLGLGHRPCPSLFPSALSTRSCPVQSSPVHPALDTARSRSQFCPSNPPRVSPPSPSNLHSLLTPRPSPLAQREETGDWRLEHRRDRRLETGELENRTTAGQEEKTTRKHKTKGLLPSLCSLTTTHPSYWGEPSHLPLRQTDPLAHIGRAYPTCTTHST
jgi:hypothetical protein